MNKENVKTVSKFISLILRHRPETIGKSLDENGWLDVNDLISGMKKSGRNITLEQLKLIVETNDKKRFAFNEDFTKIRANQGHSISVDVELNEEEPPEFLYHGTASQFVDSIKVDGLKPQKRLYVHLSKDTETAISVGKRHGKPVVLTIKAQNMYHAGYKFYLSENNVWLTKFVPNEFILM